MDAEWQMQTGRPFPVPQGCSRSISEPTTSIFGEDDQVGLRTPFLHGQSSPKKSNIRRPSSKLCEELNALAETIAEGVALHLVGAIQKAMQPLLDDQEKRLSTRIKELRPQQALERVMTPERISFHRSKSAGRDGGALGLKPPTTIPKMLDYDQNKPQTLDSILPSMCMDIADAQAKVEAQVQTPHDIPLARKSTTWFRWSFKDSGGVKSLEDMRANELLAAVVGKPYDNCLDSDLETSNQGDMTAIQELERLDAGLFRSESSQASIGSKASAFREPPYQQQQRQQQQQQTQQQKQRPHPSQSSSSTGDASRARGMISKDKYSSQDSLGTTAFRAEGSLNKPVSFRRSFERLAKPCSSPTTGACKEEGLARAAPERRPFEQFASPDLLLGLAVAPQKASLVRTAPERHSDDQFARLDSLGTTAARKEASLPIPRPEKHFEQVGSLDSLATTAAWRGVAQQTASPQLLTRFKSETMVPPAWVGKLSGCSDVDPTRSNHPDMLPSRQSASSASFTWDPVKIEREGIAAPERDIDEFHVQIDRSSGSMLGVDVKTFDGTMLFIRGISGEKGLIRQWNFEHPESQIKVDDKIVKVNGCSGAGALMEELMSHRMLDITLLRDRKPAWKLIAGSDLGTTPEEAGHARIHRNVGDAGRAGGGDEKDASCEIGVPFGCTEDATEDPTASYPFYPTDGSIVSQKSEPPMVSMSSASILKGPLSSIALSFLVRSVTSAADADPTASLELSPKEHHSLKRMTSLIHAGVSEVHLLRLTREEELLNTMVEDVVGDQSMDSPQEYLQGETLSQTTREERCRAPRKVDPYRHVWSPTWLRLCSVLPWDNFEQSRASRIYRSMIVLLHVLIITVSAEQLYHEQDASDCEGGTCLQFLQLSDLVLAVGSLLGILALQTLSGSNLLGRSDSVFIAYARRQDIIETWSHSMRWQAMLLICLWASSITVRGFSLWPLVAFRQFVGLATFAISGIVFTGLAYAILHLSLALTFMIDAYCVLFASDADVSRSVREWNTLQAVLRRVSRTVEKGFLVLQTTALALLTLGLSGVLMHGSSEIWWMLSVMLLTLSVATIIFKAADVTGRCSRVPSLINSLTFGSDIDGVRHYLVEYVTYSAAGFYVGEVRLTAAMALKVAYISVIVAFGVITKVTSASSGY